MEMHTGPVKQFFRRLSTLTGICARKCSLGCARLAWCKSQLVAFAAHGLFAV